MTLGYLCDRLSVLNIKIWFTQEWVYQVNRMDPDAFAQISHEQIQSKLKQLAELNLDRNRVMSQIDEIQRRFDPSAPQESRVKIT